MTWWVMIAVAGMLSGCNGGGYTNKGPTVEPPKNIVQLQSGDRQGIWKTNELAVKYHYQLTAETLKISGTVSLVGGFANCCNTVQRLVIRMVFLDSQESAVGSAILYTAANHHSVDWIPMNFDNTFTVPPGAVSISFDYDGELIGSANGPGRLSIWYSPI